MKLNFTRIKGLSFKSLCAVGALIGGLFSNPANSQVTLIEDIRPGTSSGSPQYLVEYDGKLIFRANDGLSGTEMWAFDYATEQTFLVQDIRPGASGASAKYFYEWNNDLYFNASDGTNGYELWKYDGDTCVMAFDIQSGSGGGSPNYFTAYKGKLYFSANDGTNGTELWSYDGTTASMVQDIYAGASKSANPSQYLVHDDTLFFKATDGLNGYELWKFDGTTAVMVSDLNIGSSSASPGNLASYNGNLYFSANSGATGTELFKYDGTGISLIQDLNIGTTGSSPSYLTVFAGNLYFKANVPATGNELYKYDGTSVSLVKDFDPAASAHGNPSYLTVYENELYMSADDPLYGAELWKYDGTTASLVFDYNTGLDWRGDPEGSSPANFGIYNGGLYFSGRNSTHGSELLRYMICTEPDVPVITATTVNICSGDNAFSVEPTSLLNDATKWGLYSGTCGGTLEGYSYDGSFSIVSSGKYYVRAEGGCSTPTICDSIVVTADGDPTINAVAPLCVDNGVVTLSGVTAGGVFTGNGVTGFDFDPATAGVGTHKIYYNVTENTCVEMDSIEVVINGLPDASVTSLTILCPDGPVETLSAATAGGTFTGNGVSGTDFDPALAGMGLHKVYYAVTDVNGCVNDDSTEVLVDAPDATINTVGSLCSDAPVVMLDAVTPGGDFSGFAVTAGFFIPQIAGVDTHAVYYAVTDTNNCTSIDSLQIVVELCASGVGVEELTNEFGLGVYPNPNNGEFNIVFNNTSSPVVVEVFNAMGRKVFSQDFRKVERASIELNNVSNGVYFLRATSKGQHFEGRLIVE